MRVIILAGGGGTRLWPLSTEECPKQFLTLGGSSSLLQQTVQRFYLIPLVQTILISTNAQYEPLVREQLARFDLEGKVRIVVEPCRRNTTPAIALSIKYLQEVCNIPVDEFIVVLPSDQLVEPETVLIDYVLRAEEIAKKGKIVLFGIRPTKPETGYGYIRIGEQFNPTSYTVDRFVEKPNLERAKEYFEDARYYWNSGIFAFTIETFWREARSAYQDASRIIAAGFYEIFSKYNELENISIDYSIMEKSLNIVVCPLPVSWSDVGSWDSVYEIMEKDQNLNVKQGNIVEIDSKNCLILGSKRVISVVGVEDLIVVETEKFLLVSRRGRSQNVKLIVQKLLDIANHTSESASN